MNDFRMKIAAYATVIGLGGLGGYALSAQQAAQTTPVADKPKTQVVRRTVHAKPKVGAAGGKSAPGATTASSGSGSDLVSGPVSGSSGFGGSGGKAPIESGSSGSGGGGGAGGGEREDETEHEDESGDD